MQNIDSESEGSIFERYVDALKMWHGMDWNWRQEVETGLPFILSLMSYSAIRING